MGTLQCEAITFAIIGAAMAVHSGVGPGFLESVYQRGIEVELAHRGVPFEAQRRITIAYRGVALAEHMLDLVVDDQVVVELKAVKELNQQHRAQVISYLAAAQLPVGLLLNFSKASLEHRRIVLADALRRPDPRNPRNPL